jgi:hypothetical protein
MNPERAHYHAARSTPLPIGVGWKPFRPRGATDTDRDGATWAREFHLAANNEIWYERVQPTDGFEAHIG